MCSFQSLYPVVKQSCMLWKNILSTYENKLPEQFLHNADLSGTNLLQLTFQSVNRKDLETETSEPLGKISHFFFQFL